MKLTEDDFQEFDLGGETYYKLDCKKELKQQILEDHEKARKWDETNAAVIENFRINPMYSVKQKKMLWYVNTEKNYIEADARRLREKLIQNQKLRELIEKRMEHWSLSEHWITQMNEIDLAVRMKEELQELLEESKQ